MRRLGFVILMLVAISGNAAYAENSIAPTAFNLDSYKGKVVYLDFWASWCGPCRFSFPYMDRIAHMFHDEGLVVIADNLDHSKEKAEAFLRETGVSIPVIYDQNGILATRFNVSEMPTSILIDRNGETRYVHKGFFKDKEREYTSHVVKLLNEK